MARWTMAALTSLAWLCACGPAPDGSGAAGSTELADQPVATPSLAGTTWSVAMLRGAAPLEGRGGAPTIAFDAAGGVSGSTGCNRYNGAAQLGEGGSLAIGGDDGAISTTRMACTPLLMQQETRMIGVLREVARYRVETDGRLSLIDAADAVTLEAVPAAPPADPPQ